MAIVSEAPLEGDSYELVLQQTGLRMTIRLAIRRITIIHDFDDFDSACSLLAVYLCSRAVPLARATAPLPRAKRPPRTHARFLIRIVVGAV